MARSTLHTTLSGSALLNDPALNKGTAFSSDEREALSLEGLLPARIETIGEQIARVRDKFDRFHDELERHIFLRALQDTNEVLFYAFVGRHLQEMLPILYTPTVGLACQEFSHIYRRPHGVFLSYPERHRMDRQLANVSRHVDVVVVTDGERILGLGDQGVGGMGIPIGKLSLYTAAGGLDPRRSLPVMLDVGTNNPDLLADPLYLGWRHERVTGADYDSFIEQFVDELGARFPGVMLQWEDFAGNHATPLLNRFRDKILSFNDDIQGTAAVALAAIHAAATFNGATLSDQRFCIVGAGSAGSGIAAMLRDALAAAGIADPTAPLHLIDADGLLHDRRQDLADFQRPFAQRWHAVAQWANPSGPTPLATVVDAVRPTVLVGVSGQPGLFTEPIVRSIAATTPRPIILPLSNPTSKAEATPADLLSWTDGRALIATGSPFDAVVHDGVTHHISQANNVYIFPGLGLGARVANVSRITDAMLLAAATGVAEHSPCRTGEATAGVLPPLDEVQTVSRRIAFAVARAATDEGTGDQIDNDEIHRRIDQHWWHAEYARIHPAPHENRPDKKHQ